MRALGVYARPALRKRDIKYTVCTLTLAYFYAQAVPVEMHRLQTLLTNRIKEDDFLVPAAWREKDSRYPPTGGNASFADPAHGPALAFLRELWALSPGLAFEYKRTVEPALAAIFMSVGVVVLEEVRAAWVADRSVALNTCAVRQHRALRQNALPKNVADQVPWPEARHMTRITCIISCLWTWRVARRTHQRG